MTIDCASHAPAMLTLSSPDENSRSKWDQKSLHVKSEQKEERHTGEKLTIMTKLAQLEGYTTEYTVDKIVRHTVEGSTIKSVVWC